MHTWSTSNPIQTRQNHIQDLVHQKMSSYIQNVPNTMAFVTSSNPLRPQFQKYNNTGNKILLDKSLDAGSTGGH